MAAIDPHLIDSSECKPERVSHYEIKDFPPDFHDARQLRSSDDDLGVFQAIKRYKVVTLVSMAAAFCASLDGYQITLNGGIVSNKGFIAQFAGPGVKIIPSKYISAWGGIQSAGQFLGQVVSKSLGILPKLFDERTNVNEIGSPCNTSPIGLDAKLLYTRYG